MDSNLTRILLGWCKENLPRRSFTTPEEIKRSLISQEYSVEQVKFHLLLLIDRGYIKASVFPSNDNPEGDIQIWRLTYDGMKA